jgi:hypothetical protein
MMALPGLTPVQGMVSVAVFVVLDAIEPSGPAVAIQINPYASNQCIRAGIFNGHGDLLSRCEIHHGTRGHEFV